MAHKSAKGSFEINEIQALIDDFFDGRKPKAASKIKADLIANVLDTKRVQNFNISYSIKSSLGNPATLLNASKLDEILASMLLLSYEYNQKDIKKLISIISKNEDENIFYKKKCTRRFKMILSDGLK